MTLGNIFLLTMLLAIVVLTVAYLHYKWRLNQYKHRGYWDLSDIKYIDSVAEILGYFIAVGVIVVLLYVVIINWNTPIW